MELAEKFAEEVENKGFEADIVDLCGLNFPLFTPELARTIMPLDGMSELMQRLSSADAWVICAPEYNGLTPPSLANTVSWLSKEGEDFRALFNGKPVGLATASGGGGEYIISAMRMQFAFLGCTIVGRVVISKSWKEANPASITAVVDSLSKLIS
jgi:NAD(P)H-dependent FMN reductase